MDSPVAKHLLRLLTLVLLMPCLARGQAAAKGQSEIDELKKSAAKVYIDCPACDIEYIKNEITFVNYVRDRNEAQVHVLVTTQDTGSGGREYTLTFMGQNDFGDVKDVQRYYSSSTDTQDEVRRGLVAALRLGLMSFVGRTPIASRVDVAFAPPPTAGAVHDPWHFWVFSLSSSGSLSGQRTYHRSYWNGDFSANRVTERAKLQLSFAYGWSKREFTIPSEARTASGTTESWDGSGLFVASLGRHWSAGAYVETSSSFYSNIKFGLTIAPAVEFNIFPYAESTRRQLRILYRIGWNPVGYRETTESGLMRETLWTERLSVSLDLREKWGTVSATVAGANHLNRFTRGHVDTFGTVSVNLYKGLNAFVLGGWSLIHDQLSLRLRPPTDDEIYLRLVELRTNSNYFFAVGVQFTFGSIFTNVINPRFGSSGSGGMTVTID